MDPSGAFDELVEALELGDANSGEKIRKPVGVAYLVMFEVKLWCASLGAEVARFCDECCRAYEGAAAPRGHQLVAVEAKGAEASKRPGWATVVTRPNRLCGVFENRNSEPVADGFDR